MKGLIISVLLAGNLAFGQNFFEQYDEGEYPVESQTFFQETTYQDYNQETGFDFFNRAYEYSEPDIEVDAGNPGDPVENPSTWT
ncbi:hypothetical protein [Moheibacter sp.]|uniref:hypothetical protein n=1 Tax=Moheibacter sp. TaxID=1965316 RepID=UPI003C7787AB